MRIKTFERCRFTPQLEIKLLGFSASQTRTTLAHHASQVRVAMTRELSVPFASASNVPPGLHTALFPTEAWAPVEAA
jgi:hypothetical protein